MSALALIADSQTDFVLYIPANTSWDDCLSIGRDIATAKRNTEWALADWVAHCQVHHGEQLALALPELTDDPKQLTRAAKVALAFPDGIRDNVLSFAHHDRVANLPADDAKALLEQSKQEGWNARRLRLEADKRSAEIAQRMIFKDNDWDQIALIEIARKWNRAPMHVREEFLEIAQASDMQDLDL